MLSQSDRIRDFLRSNYGHMIVVKPDSMSNKLKITLATPRGEVTLQAKFNSIDEVNDRIAKIKELLDLEWEVKFIPN